MSVIQVNFRRCDDPRPMDAVCRGMFFVGILLATVVGFWLGVVVLFSLS